MPDGGAPNLVYQHAVRGRFSPLIMVSGPSGVGKTYSALRLARGIAGPNGKIFLADTDNSRGRLYAAEFDFLHLDLREPFRPMLFEQAALAAQKQGADVLIIDNFAAEWNGPGGILEWHEEELARMAGDNFQRRESLKMVAWGKVKPPHKHMLQRLYQINMPIILCAAAERKIAMIKQTAEGKDKGKVIPTDQGFQPIGDKDAAYAMTCSLLLESPDRPGVPRPIKALLPDLKPIIHLDRPLDEATGAAIGAWARGEKRSTERSTERTERSVPPDEGTKSDPPGQPDPEPGGSPESPPAGEQPPNDDSDPADTRAQTPRGRRQVDEAQIEQGAKDLAAKFIATKDRKEHFALLDNADNRKQIEWLRKHRRDLFNREVKPRMDSSWRRTETDPAKRDPQQDIPI